MPAPVAIMGSFSRVLAGSDGHVLAFATLEAEEENAA